MRSQEELEAVRRTAHLRVAHGAEVEDAFTRIAGSPPARVANVWCQENHRGGSRRRLAQALHLGRGQVLFVSRIEWLPSDLLNLRPWEREAYIGPRWNPHFDDDDDLLSRWLDQLDAWEQGVPATGPRWLGGSPPHTIRVLISPGSDPVYTPWVRCLDHPDNAEIVSLSTLLNALR